MPEKPVNMPFRLAMRREGHFWNAYLETLGSMNDALLLGSIKLSVVDGDHNKGHREAFQNLMVAVVSDAVYEIIGTRPTMVERERSDNG